MNKIRGPREKHPSGRPIRRPYQRDWPHRLPQEDGPRILGLRKDRQSITAIGFTAGLVADDGEDE